MAATPAQAERLYNQYGVLVYRRCRRILGSDEDASDATQEVFARAIRTWESFRGDSSRLNWLMRISTNHCLNQIRDRRSRSDKLHQRREERPGAGSGPAGPGHIEQIELVRRVMEDCDPELQRLAVLFWFDEMSKEEIARHVGISVPTVRKRLNLFIERARRTLGQGLVTAMP